MNIEEFKNKIIEIYNTQNKNNKYKIDLTKPSIKNEDPYFEDLKRELLQASGDVKEPEFNYEDSYEEDNKNPEENLEELNEYKNDEKIIEKDFLIKIEEKVDTILQKLNMKLYRYRKDELKKLLIDDLMKINTNKTDEALNEEQENHIRDIVTDLVDHEFNEFESRKEQRREDLLTQIINKLMPEIKSFLKKNAKTSLKSMTILQKENLVKYFLISIENKYLKSEKEINSINDADYSYIKHKLKNYIEFRLKQQDDILKENITE